MSDERIITERMRDEQINVEHLKDGQVCCDNIHRDNLHGDIMHGDIINNEHVNGVSIKNMTIAYGEKVVFDGFDAEFEKDKISVILGGSGVGKTTLLNAVAGLLPYSGSIDKPEGGVSYIFQNDRLIPSISVYKNLDMVLKGVIKDRRERKTRIETMLDLLEIGSEAKKLPTQLSGGQAQRVAMARAYLYPSSVLLLDEPFKALDTALKARLIKKLIALNEREPRTIIFVTHSIDECLMCADKYFVLSGDPANISFTGSIVEDKTVRSLADAKLSSVRDELLRALYQEN